MDTTRLKRGRPALPMCDHITVREMPGGTFEFQGVSTSRKPYPAFPVVTTSVNSQTYSSLDMAVAAGVAWAERHEVKQLYVEFADA